MSNHHVTEPIILRVVSLIISFLMLSSIFSVCPDSYASSGIGSSDNLIVDPSGSNPNKNTVYFSGTYIIPLNSSNEKKNPSGNNYITNQEVEYPSFNER